MIPDEFTIRLPDWVGPFLTEQSDVFATVEDRMRLVIDLALANVDHDLGGPFGAAVLDRDSGRLISVGVNRVIASNCSIAHAEMVALSLAQRALGSYDLGADGLPVCELVTSTEPCAMCLGAIPWSGVRRVICGARDEDARTIGFDEGHKPADWVGALEERGIDVVRDVLREAAAAVLMHYHDSGGVVY